MATGSAQACCSRGDAAAARGDLDAALAGYREALAHGPCPEATHGLGLILMRQGRMAEALEVFQGSDRPEAWLNAGTAARALGRMDEARALLDRALRALPEHPQAWTGLGNLAKDLGRIDLALPCWRRAVALDPADPVVHGILAYMTAFDPGAGPLEVLEAARGWARAHAPEPVAAPPPSRRARPRIGYVSPDFRYHCQAFFTLPVFSRQDRARFEWVAYSSAPAEDAVTEALKPHFDLWRNTAGLDDAALARQVRADGIDLLVDLTQHMAGGRPLLFAQRPAPVQACWLAYPGTTGMAAMDYRLTDPYLDPPGVGDEAYAERSLRLPHSFWCYHPLAEGPDPGPLPARSAGRVTFGCLNNPCKLNPGVLATWSRVLEAVPGARLLLLAHPGEHRAWIRAQVPAGTEVEFVPFQGRDAYLATYQRIDLCLDTLPYNGHTTSLDAFWMGVPVVTQVGATVVGRAGWSQLNNLGLRDLAAWSEEAFVDIAAGLARDLDRLEALRRDLRGRMEASPLMDGEGFARDLEAAYLRMVRVRG